MEFTGTGYDPAVAAAAKHFGVEPDVLTIRVIEEGTSSFLSKKPWRIEASLKQADSKAASKDEAETSSDSAPQNTAKSTADNPAIVSELAFKVSFSPLGVFIDSETAPELDELTEYVARRGIRNANPKVALTALWEGKRPAKLAPSMNEPAPIDDFCIVRVSRDEMEASIKLFPGDPEGKRMSPSDVMAVLRDKYQIVDGIDVMALRKAVLERQLRQEIKIAQGRPPVHGEDGSIAIHFKTEHDRRPKILDGDRVDYRTLDIFASVCAGDVLVTRVPPTKGENGVTLKGKPISARSGKDARMPRGKNVQVDEENLTMTAAQNGMVNLIDGQVVVNSVYVVEQNVDMSTGNIDFMGDVEIRGNVISGMKVKAAGNIVVHGVVEAATLIADGNIMLQQGMQGNDRGNITAGGDVFAKYFERSRVAAKGAITVDAVYHSDISAAEGVTLVGKRASLIGGITRSATFVAARLIGSQSYTTTIVEVGILPEQRERYAQLEMGIKQLEAARDKLNLLVTSFQMSNASLPPERAALRDKVMRNYQDTLRQIDEHKKERVDIGEQMAAITGGKVHVLGTVHPGSRIVIGSETYNIDQNIDFATFKVTQGEIRFNPCELTQKR